MTVRKVIRNLAFVVWAFLGACTSARATAVPVSSTARPMSSVAPSTTTPALVLPTPSLTTTPLPEFTNTPPPPSPTATPSITPAQVNDIPVSPLALNEHNAAQQMQLISRIGKGQVTAVAWSPAGDYLAVATGRGVYLFATNTWNEIRLLETGWLPRDVAFNPDGSLLAVAGGKYASVWKVSTGVKIQDMQPDDTLYSSVTLVFGPHNLLGRTGYILGAGDPQAAVTLWNTETGEILKTSSLFTGGNGVAFSPDGRLMVFPSETGFETEILSVPDMKVLATEPWSVGSVLFDTSGNTILTTPPHVVEHPRLSAWDVNTKKGMLVLYQDSAVPCWYLKVTGPTGICSGEDSIWVLNLQNVTVKARIQLPSHLIDVSVNPDGTLLALANSESVIVQDMDGRIIVSLPFTAFSAVAVGMTNTDVPYLVVTADLHGDIHLWNLETGAIIRTITGDMGKIISLAISPDRQTLAGINYEGRLTLWQLSDGHETYTFRIAPDKAGRIRFTCDGTQIVMVNGDGDIFALQLSTGKVVSLGAVDSMVSYAMAIPWRFDDGGACRISTWHYEGNTVQIQNILTEETLTLPYNAQWDETFIEAIAVNTARDLIAIGAPRGGEIWSLDTRQVLAQFDGHEMRGGDGWLGTIDYLRFSPHSDLLLSVGYDSTTRLWNARTGQALRVLQVCCFAAFTPDGRYLVTAGDGVIRLWGVMP
ncbi:MAG: WD40 repeat domain-containing protein [Anaerolineae bacterium]|nr:MAG: WD40 repeat domain-containing protein [Anaerolineae bacterium]